MQSATLRSRLGHHLHRCWGRFLLLSLCVSGFGLFPAGAAAPIRVLVWDEQQPAQKQAYTNFLGNQIADHLRRQPGLAVTSTRLDDPSQGLSATALDACDVLIWWGHVRQAEIKPETGRDIVRRINAGQLSLIALHSAHWSTPFVEAMNERARQDALRALLPTERASAVLRETNQYPQLRTQPKYTDRLTPAALYRKQLEGPVEITLTLPNCCFPAYRGDGKPGHMRVLLPEHPIARHVPRDFTLAQTEMYDEPFHVPPPDAVVIEERWQPGEWFRSGSVWNLGRGKVFYFRPGHETYPVFHDANALRIIENTVRWMGRGSR